MNYKTKEQLIAFETRIKRAFEAGELPYLLHLSGGNEEQLIKIFERIMPGDWIFSTHRSHYHYLLAGGSEHHLESLIRQGRSMFVFDKTLNFFTSSIVAGTCCIAAGVAEGVKRKNSEQHIYCFVGDGAEDEGHFSEAVYHVADQSLPCTFIIEDNNRSVEATVTERRGPKGRERVWPPCVERYSYVPTYPHAGTGCKQRVTFLNPIPPSWSQSSWAD